MTRRVQLAIRLGPGALESIDALAVQERVTRSGMVRVLLREAVLVRGLPEAKRRRLLGDAPDAPVVQVPAVQECPF